MNRLLGRWDLTVDTDGERFPSWLELSPDGGRFVGRLGSARPLAHVEYVGDDVSFSLPPQFEERPGDLEFRGKWIKSRLFGTTVLDDGTAAKWVASRAPELPYRQPTWGEPVELVSEALSNWGPRSQQMANHWSIDGDGLTNAAIGSDLVTTETFSDFRLIAEYRYPMGSNSGIYLRGRYEFQVVDDFEGSPHGVGNSGAIYGFVAPSENAIRAPGEWNHADIALVGRHVTAVLNGVRIIDRAEIPGITGGALDSQEGEPGPIFVQGDHGPVTYRRLTVYPAIS